MCLRFALAASLLAEKRFSREVIKVADPKGYKTYKLDDNTFPYIHQNGVCVSAMVFRGTRYYYIEVAVNNGRSEPVQVGLEDFVRMEKPGFTILPVETSGPINEIRASLGQTFIPTPAPPPTRSTTTTSGTVTTLGNTAVVNGTSTTDVDNSAAGWHNLGQAIAARQFYNAKSKDERFASYLTAFAHERQEISIRPKEPKIFVFVFQQLKPKKAPFAIRVRVGTEEFQFQYKE